jgi:hypothetical protein
LIDTLVLRVGISWITLLHITVIDAGVTQNGKNIAAHLKWRKQGSRIFFAVLEIFSAAPEFTNDTET